MLAHRRQIAAWLVHAYTAAGGVIGMFALIEAAKGEIIRCFLLLVAATLIDGTDGILARTVRVWEVLPNFDGAMIDNLIDFFTYLWIPVFILWRESLLPHPAWLIVPIIAGLYAYGQVNMKTEDNFFLGFPTLWNVVVLYMYFLEPAAWVSVLMIVVPAILSFVPIKFLYPSKSPFLRTPSWIMALVWVMIWLYILLIDQNKTGVYISLYFGVYYLLASLYATFRPQAAP